LLDEMILVDVAIPAAIGIAAAGIGGCADKAVGRSLIETIIGGHVTGETGVKLAGRALDVRHAS